MESSENKILKLCVLGDQGVGKTSLATCFVTGNFDANYRPTYQVCHFHKYLTTPDHNAYIQIWDTSGTERFRSFSPYVLQESNGILLVYDVTNIATFTSIGQYWLDFVKKAMEEVEGMRLVLVGNKSDKSSMRQVESRLAKKFARDNHLIFYETSAVTKDNVDTVFLDGVNLVADALDISCEFQDSGETKCKKAKCKSKFCCGIL